MSTQKRDNRSQLIKSTERAGGGCFPLPAHIARYVCASAKGRTAPLMSILWSALAWAATKFLHSDHHIGQLVRPVLKADRRGSSPPPARSRAALGQQASPRSSIPHIPYPAGFAHPHRTLPHAPTTRHGGFRAERHDGKRDMYFQHAA
jgi:hypothetical protein